MPSNIIFKSRTLLPWKYKTPFNQLTGTKDNFKDICTCLGSPCLPSWRKLEKNNYGCVPFTIIFESWMLLPWKGKTLRLCTYQSTGKLDNFKGFRTCLVAVFGFDLPFVLAQIWTQRFGRMPSIIIFESNYERFCRAKAQPVRLCTYQSSWKRVELEER